MKSYIKLKDKIIFVMLVVVILGNFIFSKPVKASALSDFGGEILEELIKLGRGLGDVVLNSLQGTFYIEQDILIDAEAPNKLVWSWENYLGMVAGVGLIAVGIVASPFTGGTSSIIGVGTGVALITGGVAVYASNAGEWIDKIDNEFKLPMIAYTPLAIFSNKIPIFDINFFSIDEENTNNYYVFEIGDTQNVYDIESESSAKILQPVVSAWYYSLRNFAIVVMLVILVYIGIRMLISSVSKDKAKYKQMLMDWFVAMCLIIVMHYIMIFIINITDKICDLFSGVSVETVLIPLPQGTEYKLGATKQELESPEGGGPVWATNIVGYVRFWAQATQSDDAWITVEYTLMYLVFVFEILIFTIIYLKRVLYMAFLTIIAPLVAMTYPLDKIHDGQAQGFNKWLKEYIFNALLAPVHMLIYAVIVGSAGSLVTDYPLYTLVALGFMIPAEKMIRSLFGFQKAESAASMGAVGLATTGMLMSGLHRLMRKPHNNREREKEDTENYRFENFNSGNNRMFENYGDHTSQSTPEISENSGQQTQATPQISESNSQQSQEVQPTSTTNDDYGTRWEDYGVDPSRLGPNGEMIIETTSQGWASDRRTTNYSASGSNRSIKNGIKNVASVGWHRFKRSNPGGKLIRGMAYGAGAGALGMIGLAAGIASGDLGKTASYTASAAHVGGSINSSLAGGVMDKGSKITRAFKQGYYGTEYDQKILEEAIKKWQEDPDNIQYLRAREQNYKDILKNIYPEYARYGCNNIEDFYATYKLEKMGRSRSQAISAYKLAKRTGNITTSPDSAGKWKTRLGAEFGNVQDIRNMMNQQYRQIERELEEAQKEINRQYDEQLREIERTSGIGEKALKDKQRKLEDERDEKLKKVSDTLEAKRIRVRDIPDEFADRALDDVRQFYLNKN